VVLVEEEPVHLVHCSKEDQELDVDNGRHLEATVHSNLLEDEDREIVCLVVVQEEPGGRGERTAAEGTMA
jgi:hypothetical protein